MLPWSHYWDHNLLLEWNDVLREFTRSAYVRGGISGLGLLNVCVAVLEAYDAWQRHEPSDASGLLSALDDARRGRV